MPTSVESKDLQVTSNVLDSSLLVNAGAFRRCEATSADSSPRYSLLHSRKARNDLVLKNQFLARKIASNIWKTNPHLPFEDLVSAGIIGLIKAIDRHDSSKAQLSTFAYPYIYGEIQREIRDKWQPLKIQRKHYELKNKIRRLDEQGLEEEAIALELKISIEHLRSARESLSVIQLAEMPQKDATGSVAPDDHSEFAMSSAFMWRTEARKAFAEDSSVVLKDTPSDKAIEQEARRLSGCLPSPVGEATKRDRISSARSGRCGEIFELICCWGRTTTGAIAHHLNITQGRARDYTGRLRKKGLIIKDGFFYLPNFEQVVVEGIKKQVQQKIEVTNFLAKLEELMKIKAQVRHLEDEIVKIGGDRSLWLIESLAGIREK